MKSLITKYLFLSILLSVLTVSAKASLTSKKSSTVFAGNDTTLLCESSLILKGSLLDFDEMGTWYVFSGTGTILNPSLTNATITNLAIGNVILVWRVENINTSVINEDQIIIYNQTPTIAIAGAGTITCSSVVGISGNTPLLGSGLWSVESGFGSILGISSPLTTVRGLNVGVNILKWTISGGVCSSNATVSVNFNKAVAGTNQTICGDNITLNALSPSVNSGVWSYVNTSAPQFDDIFDPNSSVTDIQPGLNIFRWSTRNISPNSCTSFSFVTITGNMINQANAGSDQIVCADSLNLSGNLPSQGIGNWTVLTSTSSIIVNSTFPNAKLKTLSEGNNVLEWKIEKGFCITKDTVIIKNESPSKANVMANVSICGNALAISAISPTQGVGVWYSILGVGSISNPNNNITSVAGLSEGNVLLGWKTSFAACPDSKDTLKITSGILIPANAGLDQQICADTARLAANSVAGTGLWRVISGTGVVLNPLAYNSKVVNVTVNGTLALEWQFTKPGCLSTKDTVYITRDFVTPSNAGVNRTLCANFTSLGANVPVHGTGIWTTVSGGGNISNPLSATSSITNFPSGLNIFKWTISSTYCSSVSTVSVNFNQANAGINQTLCGTNALMNANPASVNSGIWTLRFPVSGNPLIEPQINDDTDPSSNISNIQNGKNIFRWTTRNISPNSCTSISEVTITGDMVNTANANSDLVICTDSLFLSSNTASQGIGTWVVLTSTSAIIVNPTVTNTKVRTLSEGNNAFEWNIRKGNCVSSDTIIIRNDSPSKAKVGSDLSICTGNTTITAVAPSQGNGNWFTVTGAGQIANPNANNTSVSGLSAGAISIGWKTSFGACPDKFDTLKITRFISIAADAGVDRQICGDSVLLEGNSIAGTGFWSVISGTGVVLNPALYNSKVKNISVNGVTLLEWQFQTPGCSFTKDYVSILRDFVTPASVSGGNQTLCVNNSVLNANAPLFGVGTWSITGGGGILSNASNASISITGIFPNANIFKWEIASTYCSSSAFVIITNNSPSPAIASFDKTVCSTSDTLKGSSITQGTANWVLLTGTGSIFSPTLTTSFVNNLGFGSNVFQLTVSKASCVNRDTLIRINNLPDIAITSNDTILCTDRMRVNANTPIQGIGTWVVFSGNVSISNINDPKATFTGISRGLNQLIWSVTSGICNSNTDLITIYNYSVAKPSTSGSNCIVLTTNTSAFVTLNSTILNVGESATWSIFPSGSYTFLPNSTNSNITVGGVGRGFYRMVRDVFDSFGGTCREKDTVLVSIIPKSNPGLDQCLRVNIGVTTISSALITQNVLNFGLGENGFWSFKTSINGNSPFPTVNTSIGVALGMRKGVHVFSYNVRNTNMPSCISVEDVKVTALTQAEAGANQCIKNVAEQMPFIPNVGNPINQVVGGQIFWSATGPAEINSATGVTNNLVLGRNKFFLTNSNTNSGCSNSDSVFVTLVTAPNAGVDSLLIANPSTNYANARLNANFPNLSVGETASWSIANDGAASSSPDAILGSFIVPITTLQNLIPGVNTFVWQIRNLANGCSFTDTTKRNVLSQARVEQPFYVTNANPTNPLSFTLSALNQVPASLRLTRGEQGKWELVDFFAINEPSSTVGVNPNTIQLSNMRRGVFNFKWTILNVNFPGFVSTANISITVLTKSEAGNSYCINAINSLQLGDSPTIPIRQLSAEKYFWTCNDPSVFINQIDTTLQISTDNSPIATISNIPIGKIKMYLHIKNTRSGFEDVDSVQITKITKADVGLDVELCVNTTQMTASFIPNTIVGESFSWTRIFGKGSVIGVNLNPIVIGLDTGKNLYNFEIQNTGCKNSDTISVSNVGPYLSTIGGTAISCFTTNYFDGNNPKLQFPTATGKWNIIAQPGFSNALMTNDQAIRLEVKDMIRVGTYKFLYTVSNKACSIVSDTFVVQRQNSIFGNAGPNASICTDTHVMQGSYPSITGVTGEWSLNAGGGVINEVNNKNATITGIPNDEVGFQNTFQWKVTLGECSSTYNVLITSYSPPTTASILGQNILSFCEKDTLYLNTNQNVGLFIGTSNWRNIEGNLLYETPTAKQTLTTFLGYGTFKTVYEVTNSSYCPVSRDTISIVRYKKPLFSSAGINQKICADTIPLNAEIPEAGVGVWSITTATSAIGLINISQPLNKILNVPPGEYGFKWKLTNGVCTDSSNVKYSVRSQITAPVATNIPPQCDTLTIAISGNTPTLGTNVWRGPFLMNGSTVLNIKAPNSVIQDSTRVQTNLYLKDIGKTALLYVIKDDFCIRYDTLIIESIPLPTPISITKDTSICSDSILIKVKEPLSGMSKWNINTLNGINIFNQTNTSLGLAMLPYGVTTFIYSIEQPVCQSKIQVVTVSNYKLENSFAGNDTAICLPSMTLHAKSPQFGQGSWYVVSGSGLFSDNANPNSEISNLKQGKNILRWTISNNQCPAIIDIVTVTNNKPTDLNALENILTFATTATIEAPLPNYGIGSWSNTKNGAIIENPSSNITNVNNLDIGDNIFRWTVSTTGCNPVFTDLKLILNDIIVPVLISPDLADGKNDFFNIRGLDKYPNSKLEVFNKWGKSVYSSSNYDNTWAGTNSDAQPLSEDTYIYVLSSKDGELIKKDFVTIKR